MLNKVLKDLYKQARTNSPFDLAKYYGISYDYHYLGPKICGVYANLNGYQIVLNPEVDNDSRDDALELLILHHNSELRGIMRKVTKADLSMVNGIEKELKRIIQDIAINGASISPKEQR